uniref:RING-type domain-containing protein n=1 Tax=Anopheles coluzzii TaxID=1518534 RepID=A0A6E8VLJ8_ANOCL
MNDFRQKFPFLVQLEACHFVGLYKKLYQIRLHFPDYPTTNNHRVSVFCGNVPVTLDPEVSSIKEVDEFVQKLIDSLDSGREGRPTSKPCSTGEPSTTLTNLALELLSIQRQYGCEVVFDKHIMHVEFSNFDGRRNHSLTLNRTGAELFKVAQHTLPELAVSELFKRQTTLQRHVQVFLDLLDQLEEFYNNLNTIDDLCYVVLPATIDTKTVYRIFKYDRKVFLKVSLHPLQPAAIDVGFFGPTKQVSKLREIYDERQDDWDADCNVYTNLLRIFNVIAFPMRPAANHEKSQQLGSELGENSCGICMNYQDGYDRVPVISCDNEQCNLIFHIHCLKEWFATQRESKKIFTISIGNCPYCTHKISSSFDEMLVLLS